MSATPAKKKLNPKVGDSIQVLGKLLVFQALPSSRHLPMEMQTLHSSSGGRGKVYQVREGDTPTTWCLKTFFPKYRTEAIVESSRHLACIKNLDGMHAAERWVIHPNDGDARDFQDLRYSVLMPWVGGATWHELLDAGPTSGAPHKIGRAKDIAEAFLRIVEQLELSSIAHTDISAANVVVSDLEVDAQLVDLEDMYFPRNANPPVAVHQGTKGYANPAGANTWCKDGDRYAAAIMAAEFVLMAEDRLARQASAEGYFSGNRNDSTGVAPERFSQAEPFLHEAVPRFTRLFREAWLSDSLTACPRIAQLRMELALDLNKVITPPQPADFSAQPIESKGVWSPSISPVSPPPVSPPPPPVGAGKETPIVSFDTADDLRRPRPRKVLSKKPLSREGRASKTRTIVALALLFTLTCVLAFVSQQLALITGALMMVAIVRWLRSR